MATAELAPLGDREFRRIVELVRSRAGIELGESKRQLCQTRLGRRLKALSIPDYRAYVKLFDDDDHPEHKELINAITTNVTAFYREQHHFDLLRGLLPKLAATKKRIRIWSAGCSSGEEPWSYAITVREALGSCQGLDVKILATDIDTQVLAKAAAGVYEDENVKPVTQKRLQTYFTRGSGTNDGKWRIADDLRSLVTFKQLNLFAPWPMQGTFDLISCRNVIIYFDVENKVRLLTRYRDLLGTDGHLFLGHSESITPGVTGFVTVGRTAYRKSV
ncbi:MAG: protein-glutamate O-methyltransferase CheR [Kofleriaceae bacterium]